MEGNGRDHRQYKESSEWFVKYLNRQGDWLEKTRGNLMVAATVIAGMSFQVMVNPPGGVWQSDNCPSGNKTGTASACVKAGTSVLEHESSRHFLYLGMVISSTVSFSASMSLILLVISGFRLRNRFIIAFLITFMVAAVICITAAFFFAIALVNHWERDEAIIYILVAYLVFWVVFLALILLTVLLRLLLWLIRFICCCCCPRRPRFTPRLLPLTPSPAH